MCTLLLFLPLPFLLLYLQGAEISTFPITYFTCQFCLWRERCFILNVKSHHIHNGIISLFQKLESKSSVTDRREYKNASSSNTIGSEAGSNFWSVNHLEQ